MSAAHDLFDALRLTLEKGGSTAYPATIEDPGDGYRYWATSVRDQIQFGAQVRRVGVDFEDHLFAKLKFFSFELRPKKREAVVLIPGEVRAAFPIAWMAIAVLKASMGGDVQNR